MMMSRMRLLPLAALLLATPALAQDRPRLEPTRDVGVTYRLVGAPEPAPGQAQPPGPMQVTLAWNAAGRQARMTNPDGSYLLADLTAGRGYIISDQHREYIVLPPPPPNGGVPGLLPPGATFTRQGQEQVAGQECTVWRVAFQGSNGRACITADGIVLRSVGSMGQGQSEAGLEAESVVYAPQPTSLFALPSGYRAMQPPTGGPGGPGATPSGPGGPPPQGQRPPGK